MDTYDERSEGRDDYRMFERFSAKLPTKFKDSPEDYGVEVSMRDCSASGARLHTRERFLIDDMLSIEVKIPDGKDPLAINGRVRWIRSRNPALWEVGMEFHKVNLMKLHRLVKFAHEVETVSA